ncbi:DUF4176 domain-containing protein [Streptococcus oralis subsp. tigurinus]|uniref:DUF4176 domain-containing protein n=1 Tax=Streptococcus oralis TaxID=1303 RepID=UPI000F21B0D9|nr:MAG: DUF4176 domain-containing protein [Streptococcus sp.]
MSNHKLLPLGSVVYLEEGTIPVMIVLRQPVLNVQDKFYYLDYAAINQIVGLEPEKITYFNHEDISNIIFEGYVSEQEERIQQALAEWVQKHPEIPKGSVESIHDLLEE